ncbi:BrnT family toxin [Verminephrobacter eiseniae]|nr:BrnT family toxin [Verminephrobacter eiseniae]
MQIGYDSDRQDGTLRQRGWDCARASEVFAGRHCTAEDLREPWGEPRLVTVGLLDCRMVAMVWAPCGEARRIISMRKANEREITKYTRRLACAGRCARTRRRVFRARRRVPG